MRCFSMAFVALACLVEPSASGAPSLPRRVQRDASPLPKGDDALNTRLSFLQTGAETGGAVAHKSATVALESVEGVAIKPGKAKPAEVMKKVTKTGIAVIRKAKKAIGKKKAKLNQEGDSSLPRRPQGEASSLPKGDDTLNTRPSFLQTGVEIHDLVEVNGEASATASTEISPEGKRSRLRSMPGAKNQNRSLIPGRALIEKTIEGLRYVPRGLETLSNKTKEGINAAKEGVKNALFGHDDEYIMDEVEAEGSSEITMDNHPRRHVRHRRRELRLGDSFAEAKENIIKAKDVIAQKLKHLNNTHIDAEGMINNSTRNIVHMLKKFNTVAEAENRTMGQVVESVWDHVKDTVNQSIVRFAVAQNKSADEDGSASDEEMAPRFVE